MTKKKKEDEEQKREKIVYKDIKVSFWRTRLHDEELGLHQEMKYQAKTRWYSKSFDMEGLIEVDDKKEYVIAFNKKDWEDAPKDANKRFILRIFTIMEEEFDGKDLKGGNYHGGIELSITHSLVQSFEVKRPAPVFFIQLPRDINLYRVVAGWRLIGTRWSWPLLPEKKGDKLQMILAKGVIGPGRNYKIYLGDVLIARIDGQPIQKEYEIEIYNEDYAKDTTFVKQLILFACSCEFMDESEKMIKRLFKKMKKTGTSDYKIPKSERDLFRNPRMMRR
ncbi:MAG: hypothetical protein R6W84_09235 [Promethearchaeia archaeon]